MANKNILEVAFSKIQENEKTELSNHDVLLNSIPQVKENIKTAQSLISKAEKEGYIFGSVEAELARAHARFIKVRDELNYHANRIIPMDNDDLIKKAKELGLNANDIPEIKQSKKLQDKLKEYIKFYDGVKKYNPQI